MSILEKHLRVTMPGGSRYDVPVEVIARNRAAQYASEFDGDIERSLAEDTVPLFEEDSYEIKDWAAGNMNWSDVVSAAVKAPDLPKETFDFEEGWMNGDKEII